MLSYRGRKIIPAPLLTISKQYFRTTAGNKLGVLYDIQINGTLLPFRGSPSGNYPDASPSNLLGAFWDQPGYPPDEPIEGDNEDFNHLLRKKEALRFLFSKDGQDLEWQPANGQPVMKCNPRIIDMNFEEGTWNTRLDYTINCEADKIFLPTGPLDDEDVFETELIQDASEDWTFDEVVGTATSGYSLVHTVTARAIKGFDETGTLLDGKKPWEHAADFVNSRAIGSLDFAIVSGALGTGPWFGGNLITNTTIDEEAGTVTVVENFLIQKQNTFTQKTFNITEGDTTEIFQISYNGIITGLDPGGLLGERQAIENAKDAIPTNSQASAEVEDILSEFLGGSGVGEPTTKDITIDQNNATVNFAFTWDVGSDTDFTKETEASFSFTSDTGDLVIDLSCTIAGKGSTLSERLNNAKSQILTDSAALAKAESLLNGVIPVGTVFDGDPATKSISINENQAVVQANWSFESTDASLGGFKISVSVTFPSDVIASIPIPGRTEGPIQQKMNTVTERIVTVRLTSENNISKPDNSTVITTMNDAGDIETDWFLDSDEEDFDLVTKNYSRTRRHIVKI